MGYLIVELNSKNHLSTKEKKKYINTFYDNTKLGFFKKFSNAIGYKNNTNDTPADLLSRSSYAYYEGNTIMKFFIEKDTKENKINKHYVNEEIGHKWAKFLKKIFPQLEVNVYDENSKPSEITSLLSFLFKVIDDNSISSGISLSKKLTKNEIIEIEKLCNKLKDDMEIKRNIKLFQYDCDTCKRNNPKSPIHMELSIDFHEIEDQRCYFCMNKLNKCEDCLQFEESSLILNIK